MPNINAQSILAINNFNSVIDTTDTTDTKKTINTTTDTTTIDTKKTTDTTTIDYSKNSINSINNNTYEILDELPQRNINSIYAGGSIIPKTLKPVKDVVINDDIDTINLNALSPHLFTIDYLLTSDKDLINEDNVYATVDKYISNYNSEKVKEYTQAFKNLYQKYSRKQYIIKNINNKVIVIKNKFENIKKDNIKGKDHKRAKHNKSIRDLPDEIVFELNKPHYLFYDNNNNLALLKAQISNKRFELQYEYQHLINKINVELPEKKNFENQRIQFIDLLETYYIYILYHKKINQILINNKTSIILQNLTNMYSEKSLLEGTLTYIDNTNIDLINNYNTDKLNQYNELIIKMQSTNIQDDILLDAIKEYINKISEITNIYNTIKNQTSNQTTIINYIITKLS